MCDSICLAVSLNFHAMSRCCALQLLDLAIADAEGLSSSVQQTSALSERVSKKVRELDTAQSRVHEAADRIKRLVNRTKAVAGVQQAIAVNDYETAAKYVEEHLQLQREMSVDGDIESPHPSEQEKVACTAPDLQHILCAGSCGHVSLQNRSQEPGARTESKL